jgi:hypothetical protein
MHSTLQVGFRHHGTIPSDCTLLVQGEFRLHGTEPSDCVGKLQPSFDQVFPNPLFGLHKPIECLAVSFKRCPLAHLNIHTNNGFPETPGQRPCNTGREETILRAIAEAEGSGRDEARDAGTDQADLLQKCSPFRGWMQRTV